MVIRDSWALAHCILVNQSEKCLKKILINEGTIRYIPSCPFFLQLIIILGMTLIHISFFLFVVVVFVVGGEQSPYNNWKTLFSKSYERKNRTKSEKILPMFTYIFVLLQFYWSQDKELGFKIDPKSYVGGSLKCLIYKLPQSAMPVLGTVTVQQQITYSFS